MLRVRAVVGMMVIVTGFALLASCAAAQVPAIVDVATSQRVYEPGDTVEVLVWARSNQPVQGRYVVALELRDPGDRVVYDSHEGSRVGQPRGDDIVLTLDVGQVKLFGPFQIQLPEESLEGTYHVITGLRKFPWEPVVEFRGGDWCPPEDVIEVRKADKGPELVASLPAGVNLKHIGVGEGCAFFVLSLEPTGEGDIDEVVVRAPEAMFIKRVFPLEEESIGYLLRRGLISLDGHRVRLLGSADRGYDVFNGDLMERRAPMHSVGIEGPLPPYGTNLLLWIGSTGERSEWAIEIEVCCGGSDGAESMRSVHLVPLE